MRNHPQLIQMICAAFPVTAVAVAVKGHLTMADADSKYTLTKNSGAASKLRPDEQRGCYPSSSGPGAPSCWSGATIRRSPPPRTPSRRR